MFFYLPRTLLYFFSVYTQKAEIKILVSKKQYLVFSGVKNVFINR